MPSLLTLIVQQTKAPTKIAVAGPILVSNPTTARKAKLAKMTVDKVAPNTGVIADLSRRDEHS